MLHPVILRCFSYDHNAFSGISFNVCRNCFVMKIKCKTEEILCKPSGTSKRLGKIEGSVQANLLVIIKCVVFLF